MLSLKSGVVATVVAGFVSATAIVVGCGANGPTDEGDPVLGKSATDPADSGKAGQTSKKIGARDGGSGSSSDNASSSGSAQKPAGDDDDDDWLAEAGAGSSPSGPSSSGDGGAPVDAGPPAPDTGETCSTADTLYTRTCGHCGKQQAVCALTRGGSLLVTTYGPCGGETGTCSTGDTQPCGKCGTATCGSTCGWGTCKNEGVCRPGVVQHDTAGCPTPGTYRSKACLDTCQFDHLTACEPPALKVPPPGVTSSTQWELTTAMMGKRPDHCRKTSDVTSVPAFPIPLTNDTDAEVSLMIWHTSAGSSVDTVLSTYDSLPSTDSDYKACKTEPQDNCDITPNPPCQLDGTGSFAGVNNVKVAAHSTIIVYNAGWLNDTVGKFVLNIKQNTP